MNRYVPAEHPAALAQLISLLPELRESYDEHVIEEHGELIAYTYLPDVVRLLSRWQKEKALSEEFVKRFGDAVEAVLKDATPSVEDLIALALLDELHHSDVWSAVRGHLGPLAKTQLRKMDRR